MLLFKNRNCKTRHIKLHWSTLSLCRITQVSSKTITAIEYTGDISKVPKLCQRCLKKYQSMHSE